MTTELTGRQLDEFLMGKLGKKWDTTALPEELSVKADHQTTRRSLAY